MVSEGKLGDNSQDVSQTRAQKQDVVSLIYVVRRLSVAVLFLARVTPGGSRRGIERLERSEHLEPDSKPYRIDYGGILNFC